MDEMARGDVSNEHKPGAKTCIKNPRHLWGDFIGRDLKSDDLMTYGPGPFWHLMDFPISAAKKPTADFGNLRIFGQ